MAKLQGLKVSRNEISQELDLKEIFGVEPNENLKRSFAARAIERIQERTAANRANTGRNFRPSRYSEEYADTLEFKAAGKRISNVNMRLSGDMLGSIDELPTKGKSKVKFGVSEQDELDKAHGHMTGDGTAPKRPWFGLNNSDVQAIKKELKPQANLIKERQNRISQLSLSELRQLTRNILSGENNG
jgi:hypothetical protein